MAKNLSAMRGARSLLVLAAALVLAGQEAFAANSAQASGALALAALVGRHSPLLSWSARTELKRLLAGHATAPYPAHQKIVVRADSVVCRAGNVDITAHACTLTFGSQKVSSSGRKAHELFATLFEVGAQGSAAAGTSYRGVTHLVCTVDPQQVAQRAGGGAMCGFTPWP